MGYFLWLLAVGFWYCFIVSQAAFWKVVYFLLSCLVVLFGLVETVESVFLMSVG